MLVPSIKLVMVREKCHDYRIYSSENVFQVLKEKIREKFCQNNIEVFGFIGLETNNKIVFIDESMKGSVNESRVYVAEIARKLLMTNCSQVILFHNHPSGNLKASDSDINVTEKIKQALSLFEIKVLDHLILSEYDFLSFKEQGLL